MHILKEYKVSGNANQYFSQDDFEFEYEGKKYYAEVHASAFYQYIPGKMYHRNGDPGDPPDEIFDVLNVTLENVIEVDTGESVTPTEDMINTVWGMLEDGDYDWNDFVD